MSDFHPEGNGFLKQLNKRIEENLSNEQFGVSELAREIGMSRSNLLRKVKSHSGLSVSQYIRKVRLQHAMQLLKGKSQTVSEISYQVGFNSTSYFIKCFREQYGYPPGEAEKRGFDEGEDNPERRSHRLAAIMFTDIVGYTALMQQDEKKALEIRNRHRQIFNSVTSKFKGRILQYYGDGTLSIFHSAIEAVKCGIELQLAFRSDPQIPVRIGIHSGDIIINEEDIIGDGVNIASRIESLAVPGSVFISAKVYDEVKNQTGIQAGSLGSFDLKNVDVPQEVFAITNPGLVVPQRQELKPFPKSKTGTEKAFSGSKWKWSGILWFAIPLVAIVGGFLLFKTGVLQKLGQSLSNQGPSITEKSIAVLPFINDSNDSANVYIINGLMESILNHLQKMEDLRVISRTSVEKYRNTTLSIPELAKELGVRYFVEGSGQKIGDQILLHVQLIEAADDQHLWAGQYDRDTEDIFQLQKEVARKIADEIKVVISPVVEEQMEKVPTDNLEAYDFYLRGRELFFKGNRENLEEAIFYYKKAIDLDPEFANAYAGLSIVYYFLDYAQAEKQYSELINTNADKALLYDPQLPQSLIAKALFYFYTGEPASALPHLEKALEYNPNSAAVINMLSDYYTRYDPDTEKYLEYALKGIALDIASNDSVTTSFIFLHVSNALIQSGFVEEAVTYINKSIAYDPENLYSDYVKAFILYARNLDLTQTRKSLLKTLKRDSTRLDVMQEVAKICYFQRDYASAYKYYKKFTEIRQALQLDIYASENLKIAMVMRKLGKQEEAETYLQRFSDYVVNDQSIYKDLNKAMMSAFNGDTQLALDQMELFSKEKGYHYWILLFFEMDPVMDEIKSMPAFRETMKKIEDGFWARHKTIRANLEEKGLL